MCLVVKMIKMMGVSLAKYADFLHVGKFSKIQNMPRVRKNSALLVYLVHVSLAEVHGYIYIHTCTWVRYVLVSSVNRYAGYVECG